MRAVSQLIVHVFDLIEAEGRDLRTVLRGEIGRVQTAAMNVVWGAALLLMSVALSLAGLWLLASGLMWWLETQVSRPLAAGLTGLAVLTVAAGCLFCFKSLARRRQS